MCRSCGVGNDAFDFCVVSSVMPAKKRPATSSFLCLRSTLFHQLVAVAVENDKPVRQNHGLRSTSMTST